MNDGTFPPPFVDMAPNAANGRVDAPEGSLYLIRLSQSHETFRKPELESLASLLNITLSITDYRPSSPFCVIRFNTRASRDELAKNFIAHSLLSKCLYEFYATGTTYDELHANIKALPPGTWTRYKDASFRFSIDAFCGKRTMAQQREIVEGFGYLPLKGRIRLKRPDEEFVVFEEWALTPEEHSLLNRGAGSQGTDGDPAIDSGANAADTDAPRRLFFGRYIADSRRDLITKHDLKKRPYISTTSMDAELALVTACLAKARPGALFLDPFTGTGGFMIAAAELGAIVLGADIDGRSFRGKGKGLEKGVGANFRKYRLEGVFGDCVTADLTNSPFRLPGKPEKDSARWLDGITCDPPYGVREGLKVLGRRVHDSDSTNGRTLHDGPYFVDGVPSHTLPDFIAPKRPYSFNRMLDDIMDFAARTLVDGGRLAFWMPCANDADEEFPVPKHDMLGLKHSCIQVFNKWSRRLLVYERVAGDVAEDRVSGVGGLSVGGPAGHKADELNHFRRMYFRGFAEGTAKNDHG
ncbi:hypothetical protein LTR70_005606 [Exophiala xenobiotica]|uniref:Uncharacterized protein n=1 Tax=Lithohypha guttulata TaxID=1690604 RepID=A0ABR0K967_9EURO|nr:hypothetical protein LTR24_005326 [Lithohypha guttulata]KAK5318023.1 hypothetical protein LTR70_005606 [Exophiala xenobiotica]